MKTPKQPLKVRQGMAVGFLVLAVLAPGISARSDTPYLALVETLTIGLIAVFGVGALAVAINRRRARPPEPRLAPPLNVRRASILGLAVGMLTEAALSARMTDPLETFVSNIVFALWVALLVAGAILVVERRSTARHVGP